MTFQEISSKLKERFGGAVLDVKSEGVVEPSIAVAAASVAEISAFLRDETGLRFDYLMCLSGTDNGKELLGVVYHLGSIALGHRLVVRVEVPAAEAAVPTVSGVWPSANWHEREAWDLLGIRFEGHPDLRRILLPDDYPGHPLRKDFKVPEFYNGMKVPY